MIDIINYALMFGLFVSGCGIGFLIVVRLLWRKNKIGQLKYRATTPKPPEPNYLGGHPHKEI